MKIGGSARRLHKKKAAQEEGCKVDEGATQGLGRNAMLDNNTSLLCGQ